MSRERLTWIDRKKRKASDSRDKKSRRRKSADPYQMNQDKQNPDVSNYMIGGPSAFAAERYPEVPDDPELGRNEIGLYNMPRWAFDHKGYGGDEPYDNAHTFTEEDRDRDSEVQRIEDNQIITASQGEEDVYKYLEKKASHCLRISKTLLPDADEQQVEDQALDLMDLPDHAVQATSSRIQTGSGKKAKKSQKESELDQKIESFLRDELGLEEKLSQEDVDVEVDEPASDPESDLDMGESEEPEEPDLEDVDLGEEDMEMEDFEEEEEGEPDLTEDRLRRVLEDVLEDIGKGDLLEGEEEEEAEEEEAEEEEEEDLSDEEVESMLKDMENQPEGGSTSTDQMVEEMTAQSQDETSDLDIELNQGGGLDLSESSDQPIDEDQEMLQEALSSNVPDPEKAEEVTAQKSSKEGVDELGGQVSKQSNNEESDLEKLWNTDPDVSGAF